MSLTKKIDFALIIGVKNANPNGDPLNGNRPRTDFEGNGEITDVCLKRKIRDRLQEDGESLPRPRVFCDPCISAVIFCFWNNDGNVC